MILYNVKNFLIMKKTITSACMLLVSLACAAQSPVTASHGVLGRLKNTVQKPYSSQTCGRSAAASAVEARQSAALADARPAEGIRLLDAQELRRMAARAAEGKTERLDSVVCAQNSTGEKISLQTFEYDADGLPMLRVNSLADGQGGWTPVEYYGYEWDDDGYCLSQWGKSDVYNSGQRFDYTYNDRKLGDTQTIYNYMDGEWVPFQKGEYWYDERGNLDEEKVYVWADGQWTPASWITVSFDEAGRQTSYYERSWNGTEWVIVGDKMEYAYDEDGHQTLWAFWAWQEDTQSWLNWYRIEQDFNDQGLITRQESLYWNKTRQNWDGAEDYGYGLCYNTKTLFEYDELWRNTLEDAFVAYNPGEYVNGGQNITTWTALDDGGSQGYTVSLLYDKNGENPWEEGRLTKRYDAAGNLVYDFETKYSDGRWNAQYSDEYEYDEEGRMTLSRTYLYEDGYEDRPLASSSEERIYDDNDNVIEAFYQMGQGTGPDDWMNTTRFTYVFEQDTVCVEQLAYMWDGSDYVPNWGEGVIFDFTVPVSDLMQWIGASPYHKTVETRSYTGVNGDWDWQAFKYHYTSLGTSGIGRAETSDGEAVEVARYDLSGRRIAAPVSGVNIVEMSDGSVRKVIVR